MKDLYHVPTRAYSLGLGVLIFDAMASVCIIGLTFGGIFFCRPGWKRAQTLHFGMVLLSIWTLLNWIDQAVRRSYPHVTYSYIFLSCVLDIFRVPSNIFMCWGVLQVAIRSQYLRNRDLHYRVWILGIPLWIMGVYFICLQFAVAIAWLSFADVQVIQRLAKAKNGLEIALSATQFVTYLIASGADYKRVPKDVETDVMVVLTCVALCLRSFVEVIIVGQLDRWPVNLPNLWRARDVVFHLCSIFAVGSAAIITWEQGRYTRIDHLYEEETNEIGKVTSTLRTTIQRHMEEKPNGTFPPFEELLKEVERKYESENTGKDYRRKELNRLRKCFKDWTPINRTGQSNAMEKDKKTGRPKREQPSSRLDGTER